MTQETQAYKRQAAAQALQLVEADMVLGLGSGSTALAFVELLAERIKEENLKITCIATSEQTRAFAEQHGIKIADFNTISDLDLTVDGADEIDHQLNLLKGGGGALLREKIVAMASDHVCIIADNSKLVRQLGAFPLPVEIADFGLAATIAMIETAAEDAGCKGEVKLRRTGTGDLYRTDGGHLIADCAFGAIPDVETLADLLDIVPGVMEHGLFLGIADDVFLAGPEGAKHLQAGRDDDDED
ncbi:MAG TPA: ribose-5-phosphate isomerase RpiA [Geobacterales bacterium]|nr:ribose-5-phosphate isomerase RpiA [Geobacterales bacterium]